MPLRACQARGKASGQLRHREDCPGVQNAVILCCSFTYPLSEPWHRHVAPSLSYNARHKESKNSPFMLQIPRRISAVLCALTTFCFPEQNGRWYQTGWHTRGCSACVVTLPTQAATAPSVPSSAAEPRSLANATEKTHRPAFPRLHPHFTLTLGYSSPWFLSTNPPPSDSWRMLVFVLQVTSINNNFDFCCFIDRSSSQLVQILPVALAGLTGL